MSIYMPGPCTRCGALNYALSAAGPSLCPPCSDAVAVEQRKADSEAWKHWGLGPAAGTTVNGRIIERTGLEMPYADGRDEGKGHFGVLGEIGPKGS